MPKFEYFTYDSSHQLREYLDGFDIVIPNPEFAWRIQAIEFIKVNLFGEKIVMQCAFKMADGVVVLSTEPSMCVNPKDWENEIGMQITYESALNELKRLEGYRNALERASNTVEGFGDD